VFGRPRQHRWLGTDTHTRVTNAVVWALGGLFLLLVVVAALAALAG
jgi:hypothetical protein